MKAKVFEHQELVSLHDRATGEEAGRFTTRTVRAQDWTATDCGRQRGPISSIQAFAQRPSTAQDVARQLDPAYAAAADRAAELRKEAAEVGKSIAHYEGVLQASQHQGDKRWRDMGFLRQVAHKTGARRDLYLSVNESTEQMAVTQSASWTPSAPNWRSTSRRPKRRKPWHSRGWNRSRRPRDEMPGARRAGAGHSGGTTSAGLRARAAAGADEDHGPRSRAGAVDVSPAPTPRIHRRRDQRSPSGLHASRPDLVLVIRRNRAAGRGGSFSGFHPAMVLAHCRACSLSLMPGNRRRNSTAAANSPPRSNAARIAAASSSETVNIRPAWKCRPPMASESSVADRIDRSVAAGVRSVPGRPVRTTANSRFSCRHAG